MFKRFVCIALLAFIMAVNCADYIIAFKKPVTEDTYKQAKEDVESIGGEVTFEFHSSTKGVMVTLPDNQITTMRQKLYVDFIEKDMSVHI